MRAQEQEDEDEAYSVDFAGDVDADEELEVEAPGESTAQGVTMATSVADSGALSRSVISGELSSSHNARAIMKEDSDGREMLLVS